MYKQQDSSLDDWKLLNRCNLLYRLFKEESFVSVTA